MTASPTDAGAGMPSEATISKLEMVGLPSAEAIEAEIRPMSYEGADLTECVERIRALFSESANNSAPDAHVGLPSEEEIAAVIDAAYCEESPRETVQRILSLIRPAFERIERERDEFYRDGLKAEDKWIEWEARALSAEAKLAQAVEALEPFARADRALGDTPGSDGTFRLETDTGYREIPREAFRRARSAARGETP